MKKSNVQSFNSVWDALGEKENVRVKSSIAGHITRHIREKALAQAEASKILGLTQPRMSDLFNGRISKFSLDALVNIAAGIGLRISVEVSEEVSQGA